MAEKLEKIAETALGFRDITEGLKNCTLEAVEQGDVVRGIFLDVRRDYPDNIENPVQFYFLSKEYNMKGRVFPESEILSLQQWYDIIIQNPRSLQGNLLNVDAQVYHDFTQGEIMIVSVSASKSGGDYFFKLFNKITGFVKERYDPKLYAQINDGGIVQVEVVKLIRTDKGRLHPFVRPVQIIS